MIKRLIVFLIRKRLNLKLHEPFQFVNQRSNVDYYWFTETGIKKYVYLSGTVVDSGVSLNWLLNDECDVINYELLY